MTAMAVEVRLPTLLRAARRRRSVGRRPRARPWARCSRELTSRYPGLADQLVDGAGGLHKFVNVYRNDDDIRYLDQLDTKVADGDTISILPAVAGG